MKLPPFTIIPAGAGSGKTYTIQKTLADWVTSGQVRPDRIVAVRDLELADVPGFTLRFRLDLTPLIEQNRRRSRATLADFVIEEAAKTA